MYGLIITITGFGGVLGWIKFLQADDRANVWETKYWALRKEHNRKFGVHYGYKNYQYNPNPKFESKSKIYDVDL